MTDQRQPIIVLGASQDDPEDEEPHQEGGNSPLSLPPAIPPRQPVANATGTRLADSAPTPSASSRWRRLLSSLIVVVVVLAGSAFIKSFVVQTFEIPSASMEPTLVNGDRVAVTMYDSKDLRRGDIVVFRDPGSWLDTTDPTGFRGALRDFAIAIRLLPEGSGHHLIKRVIGMPGDRVVADGHGGLTVNGVQIHEPYLRPGTSPSTTPFDVVVPEGCVWVMGDNRSNSADSRFHTSDAHGGALPLTDVVGVAKGIVWPFSHWGTLAGGREAFKEVPAADPLAATTTAAAVALREDAPAGMVRAA
ncbi:signal peptidase I [Actinomyces gaoshouyii]|uniref:signal peptidase I n=1 Tax=Actinomyces gaoshouyii TaxID=1960083 RepID=UPI0009C0714B|nr:signal peptidase I [Actinomyces gaoshouyii]ARD41937.1 signal peptidase I [Actinomyces gaoshouyii]